METGGSEFEESEDEDSPQAQKLALEERLRFLMSNVSAKTSELVATLGPALFLEVYTHLQSALHAAEEPDQSQLDAYTAAKLPPAFLNVQITQIVHFFYIIISHQLEIKAAKDALKALDSELT